MSIEIHPNCRKRLTEGLAAALPQLMVNNGGFLDYGSAVVLFELDSALPESRKPREMLSRFVGEFPFSDFVRGAIQTEIYRAQPYTRDKNPTPLTALDAYRDAAAAAARLVADFVSLPWKYTFTIPLPQGIAEFFGRTLPSFALSTEVRVVTPDEQLVADYEAPPHALNPVSLASLTTLADVMRAEWDRNRAYLQVQVEGFIPMLGRSAPLEDGIGHIQSFFGLGLAHHLFDVERRSGETPTRKEFWIHRSVGDKWELQRSVELDHSISGVLDGMAMGEAYAEMESGKERAALARRTLESMSAVFSAGPLSERLLLASQWHFESFSGSDEMLSFVQAVVVLEILLGDKAASDVVGLGELLRNRCAYLISRSQAERERVLEEFRKTYDVRSKIVHAGKRRLHSKERFLLFRLRRICQRVIQEEAKLLTGKRR